ncbi:hypothetical protein DCAR_0623323 [Daucus carota subsp. sativus]|uniref:NAD(P)H-quinone oxidoreductase subunit 2 N-terminal domain-containing protein n=1 Tax=Daucus carota subsp. sativus TaxID=79200 RepID=A0AAF1B2Q2_DAUCS|nr:hypothetical protein DCAR_0623323 [Daucus carota subsp. sativus]
MIWHVQNENFILDSTRIFMKAFHLLLFDESLIFPKCILIFGLILLLMIDSTSDQKDIPSFPSTMSKMNSGLHHLFQIDVPISFCHFSPHPPLFF